MLAISSQQNSAVAINTLFFITVLLVIYFVYSKIYPFIKAKVAHTPGKLDDVILELFKVPVLSFVYWFLLEIFSRNFLNELLYYPYLLHFNKLVLIGTITWMILQLTKAVALYLKNKLNVDESDNLQARKNLTQINVFKSIINTIVVILSVSAALLIFDQARTIGISLITSAGIIGIIVGFAAQKSIGMILAGIQLAITQPIRIDDVVIVEGEWGRVEEISLTYVVVKIWDERRLVVPVNHFLEKTFQNWTRNSADIIGTLFVYVDFSFPVDELRIHLSSLLAANENWDGRVANIQVTNATSHDKELRVMVSSSDASKNWDLRVTLREQLIDFIVAHFPTSLAKIRIEQHLPDWIKV